ncbi:hypothetical protein IRZ71_19355 [Flavobacterium sp. ANB]|uniref:hypothetical protein n=1 Tax=unclassified Flavobacterium TaxID=196869 RepID=UPI0012B80E7A|nr:MULTISPECIES: hypothetical protein [unclassified Flavobacterium]MBF4518520.1 hypothetical protein [Flavobacterium sp. ANB]MTD67974.1 hypothetical protein [Flavobacterium sp. LC2016-13]
MIKKLFLLSLVASQLMVSCSSDDSPETDPTTDPTKELTLEEQIANILKQPYASLSPADQKIKLEAEANEMLVQLDKTKKSSAIEAIENLNNLLIQSSVDIFNGKSNNGIEEALTVSGAYGIYTWNNTQKIWLKTASSTDLKFVFPAKKGQTTNNSVFTVKSTSSDIKFLSIDTYGEWEWNSTTGQYTQVTPDLNDWFYLPTSADAVLTIDNGQVATFNLTAKYANGKEVPTDLTYKVTLNDGYTWEMSSTKAVQNTAKADLTYNGKNLISFTGGSNTEVDKLIGNDELGQYRGKANGLFTLLDNFVILADMNLATDAADRIALEKNVPYPAYNSQTYYTDINTYHKKIAEGKAAAFNKNIKLILVSKKDGTKIADIVQHAEKENNNYPSEIEYYNAVNYLKFNDKTEVEMGAYFSTGFNTFQTKFNEFTASFQK